MCESLKNTVKLIFSKEMRLIILNMVWVGATTSYQTTILTPLIILQLPDKTEKEQFSLSLFAFTAFGAGEVLGGFIHGLIIDKIGSKKAVILNVFFIIIAMSCTQISLYTLTYNYLTFITTFLWGYQDGMNNIFLFQILGFEFEQGGDPFAVMSIVTDITCFTFDLVGSTINTKSQRNMQIYTGVYMIFAIVASSITYWFPFTDRCPSVKDKE